MRIRFRNSAFAAAFVTAVVAQANKHATISILEIPELDELAGFDGPVPLNVDVTNQEAVEIYVEDDQHAVIDWQCNDITNLNYSVNRVVPPTPGASTTRAAKVRGYDVVIDRTGGVTVGCKVFSGPEVERILGVAKRRQSGIGFREFRTTNHRIWAVSADGKPAIGIDNDGRVTPEEVEQIVAARNEFLSKQPANPVPTYNFAG